MLEEMLDWLNSMTHEQKQALINNLNEFQRLKTLLTAKKIVIKDPESQDLWIVKDHEVVPDFLACYKKLTMRGIKVIDKRK